MLLKAVRIGKRRVWNIVNLYLLLDKENDVIFRCEKRPFVQQKVDYHPAYELFLAEV